MEDAGRKLKQIRERLGLTYRDVEQYSSKIAEARKDEEFVVALSRLADIENKGTIPTFHRLYSLCAIYKLDLVETLNWFGVPVDHLPADAALVQLARTNRVGFQNEGGEADLPIALDPGIDFSRTLFLSRFIQRWGKLPLLMLNHVDLRNLSYGLIGTDDWSMFPIISPGSLVVIDQSRRKVINSGWSTEFERPIYFLEHREGYACCWCTLRDDILTLQPHPSSFQEPQAFEYPKEIEVIGQVTSAALTLDAFNRGRPRE